MEKILTVLGVFFPENEDSVSYEPIAAYAFFQRLLSRSILFPVKIAFTPASHTKFSSLGWRDSHIKLKDWVLGGEKLVLVFAVLFRVLSRKKFARRY